MTDPYRGSARPPGSRRRGYGDDDDLDGFLSEIGGRDSGHYGHPGPPDRGYARVPGDRPPMGRARGARDPRGATARVPVSGAGRGRVRPDAPYGHGRNAGYARGAGHGRSPGHGRGGHGRPNRHRPATSLIDENQRKRKIVALGAVAVMLLGFIVLAGTYFVVSVPAPKELAAMDQTTTILPAKGKEPIAKVGSENRRYVPIEEIPTHVQHAVVTAEDRTFYSNSGIDVKGIMRAAVNNIVDDDLEGASTITQQYVRNAFLTQEVSYKRKLKEAVMAVKINQELEKQEILEGYLNTIYFGRGAYGIGAAAETYFGKRAEKLTVEEGAVLAAMIKSPGGAFDPAHNPEDAEKRWRWVLDSMVGAKWLDQEQAAAAELPETQDPKEATGAQFGLNTPIGNVVEHVKKELKERAGIGEHEFANGGYTIRTTIDLQAQRAAEEAVENVLKGQPKKLTAALVGVEPGTGRVLAYYGNKDGIAGWDNAGSRHQPGSSFKAYVLAAALENDISIKSYWDGSSPQEFPDRKSPVRNSENLQCKRCTLEDATVKSLNTTYYALTHQLKAEKVVELAHKAGIRVMNRPDGSGKYEGITLEEPGAAKRFSTEVGIGQFPVSVLDNANGFATFAAGGEAADVRFVDKVKLGDKVVYEGKSEKTRAFSEDTAADATHVMQKVVKKGGDTLEGGRPAAGKTGTWQLGNTDDNAHAWMAGYTPQLASAVWMGHSGDEGALKTKEGARIYGSMLPADIWKAFMSGALEGKPVEQFPKPVYGGDKGAGTAESPSPSPEPSESIEPSEPGDDGIAPRPSDPDGGPLNPSDDESPGDDCGPLNPSCRDEEEPGEG